MCWTLNRFSHQSLHSCFTRPDRVTACLRSAMARTMFGKQSGAFVYKNRLMSRAQRSKSGPLFMFQFHGKLCHLVLINVLFLGGLKTLHGLQGKSQNECAQTTNGLYCRLFWTFHAPLPAPSWLRPAAWGLHAICQAVPGISDSLSYAASRDQTCIWHSHRTLTTSLSEATSENTFAPARHVRAKRSAPYATAGSARKPNLTISTATRQFSDHTTLRLPPP